MDLWKVYCNKSELELKNMTESIFLEVSHFSVAKGRKVMLPRETNSKLAYLLGYTMGDGCLVDYLKRKVSTGSFKYEIKIASTTEDFAKNVLNPLFKNSFGIKGNIYKTNSECFVLYIQSKVLYVFLNKIFEFPIGKKKGKLIVPRLIKKSEYEIKKSFVAGFFDADGHVYIKNKEIAFTQADRRFLEELSEILNDIGINTRRIYQFKKEFGTTYSLTLKWNSVGRFVEDIPILYPDKVDKINELRRLLL